MDVCAHTDINPSRGLHENQCSDLSDQPPADEDLLLVPAAELPDWNCGVSCPNGQFGDYSVDSLDAANTGHASRKVEILTQAQVREEPVDPIGRHEANATSDQLGRAQETRSAEARQLTVESLLVEQPRGHLDCPASAQSCQCEDLPGIEQE
jgi:hypothetical protein